jgi:uncharacterized repeat protein (TIGR01451 family)
MAGVTAGVLGLVLCAGTISVHTQATAPGGVSAGLVAWQKANDGVSMPMLWNDSGAGNNDAAQEAFGSQPIFVAGSAAGAINFNPGFDFDGVNDFLDYTSPLGIGGLADSSTLLVYRQDAAVAGVLFGDGVAGANQFDLAVGATGTFGIFVGGGDSGSCVGNASTTLPTNEPGIGSAVRGSSNMTLRINGGGSVTIVCTTPFTANPRRLGARNGNFSNATIAEVIEFDRALSTTELQRAQSYLAIKYGITLRQTPAATNYVDSGAAVVWDATANVAYGNNITGIGRDDASALGQKQSRSVNTTGSGNFLTMGLGTIAADNASNATIFPADRSFLVWGDDAGSIAMAVPVVSPGSTVGMRMSRTWRTEETGAIGTVKVGVPSTTASGGVIHLVVSNDATFNAADLWVPLAPFTPDGVATYLAADADFTSGQFFTFATVLPVDFGDSPASYGTLLANDGARHGVPGYNAAATTAPLMFGALIDVEVEGAATGDATGDDAIGDDEDGVTFPPLVAGLTANLSVTVTNAGPAARLSAWADWNHDGAFGAGEQTVMDFAVVAGANAVPISVPATTAGPTIMRFRLSTQTGLGPTGAAADGEVEDYQVLVGIASDLAVTKTADQTSHVPGAPVTYTIVVTNAGPSNAGGVTVADAVPAAIGGVTASCSDAGGASCGTNATSGNNVSFTRASLAAGAGQLTIAVSGTIDPSTTGTLVNTATVASTVSDPILANNTSTVQTAVIQHADVGLTKVVDNGAPNVGTIVTFTVTATNAGPRDATDLRIADALPEGLRLVGAAPSVGTFDSATRVWSVVSLAAGASGVLVVTAEVMQSGTRSNVATIVSQLEGDPDTSNNVAGAAINAPAAAELRVVKQGDVENAALGSPVNFTVSLTNAGPDPAAAIQVLDTLPTGLTFLSATPSAGTFDPTTGLWTINALAVGANATLQLTATVSATGTSTNIAQVVSSGAYDPAPANNAGGASVNGLAADVQVMKTVDRPESIVGEAIVFTILASNLGPSRATGLVLEDRLPPGLQFQSAMATHGTYDETTGLWTLGTLGAPGIVGEPDTLASLTIEARVTRPGAWQNHAIVVNRDLPDLNPLNDEGAVTVGARNDADLAVAKTVNVSTVPIGGTVVFAVTLTNAGPADATGLVLADTLSSGLTFVSATATAGSFDTATRRWTVPALSAGAAATLTVTATATASGSHSNTIAVESSDQPDADPSNNTAGAALNVPAAADLQVVKTAERVFVPEGAAVGFNIRVRNAGPDIASNVVVSEILPASLTFVLATASTGGFDPVTGRWTIGTLATGTEATLRVVARASTADPVTNTASVSGDQVDAAPGNNTSTAHINTSSVDLAVTIATVGPPPLLGDLATVRVALVNLASLPATGVEVDGLLATGLRLVRALPAQGTFDAATGRWSVGAVAPTGIAAPVTLDLVVRLHQAAQAIAAEIARVDQIDTTSSNDRADIVLLGNAWSTFHTDLAIAATASPAFAMPGADVTFVASSTNRGPTLAQDVVITAALPPGLGFVSVTASDGSVCAAPAAGVNGVVTCRWPGVTVLESDARRELRVIARTDAAIRPGTELVTRFETTSSTTEYHPPNNVQDIRLSVPDGTSADLALGVSVGGPPTPLAEAAVPVAEAVAVRVLVTNTGPVPISGTVLVDWPGARSLQLLGATASQGSGTPSPTGGVWEVGPLPPGSTAVATLTVRLLTTEAVTIVASRIGATPADVNADNDVAAVRLDGTGGLAGGRWTTAGNIDGLGGAEIIVGSGMLETPMVRVYSGSGVDTGLLFNAFDRRFLGGVRVAACDVDGDGRDEIITAAGPGGGPHIRILRVRASEIAEIVGFYAFEPDFGGGVHAACIDVNADGAEEVVVSAGAGRAPEVRVFSTGPNRADLVTSWLAYDSAFAGGVRVADVPPAAGAPFNLITTPGPGRAPELRGWQVGAGRVTFIAQLGTGFPAIGTQAGVVDLDGNGELELLVTPDPGVPAVIRLFSAVTGQSLGDASFYSPTFLGGVRFSIGVLDGGPGRPEVITSQGPGGLPRIETYYLGAGGRPAKRLDFVAIEIP